MNAKVEAQQFGDAESALIEVRQATTFLKAVVSSCGGALAGEYASSERLSEGDFGEIGLLRSVSGLELLARALLQLDVAEKELDLICKNPGSSAPAREQAPVSDTSSGSIVISRDAAEEASGSFKEVEQKLLDALEEAGLMIGGFAGEGGALASILAQALEQLRNARRHTIGKSE